MLILARDSRGLTQQELAEALGVNQSFICKIESGQLAVSTEYLEKIARILRYPIGFFYQTDKVRGVGSACNYHRKRESLSRRDWYKITARLNILRLHTSKLLNGVKMEHENRFHYLDSDDIGSPERAAKLIRRHWRMPDGPVGNLIGEIENAGGVVVVVPFGTDKLDAISQAEQGVPPLFLVNSEIPGDRLRFTLAHEVGHIVMHSITPSDDPERDADRFAAEFLMPEQDIADDLESITIKKAASVLKPYWKVAISALIRRARDLKIIDSDKYVQFCKQLSYYGYRKHEPVDIPLETPTVLKDMIGIYLSDYNYGAAELGNLLLLHSDEVTEEYIPPEYPLLKMRVV